MNPFETALIDQLKKGVEYLRKINESLRVIAAKSTRYSDAGDIVAYADKPTIPVGRDFTPRAQG